MCGTILEVVVKKHRQLFELNYIMQAIWKRELYFVVPFLWMSYCFFVTVSGKIIIIVVFWNLC